MRPEQFPTILGDIPELVLPSTNSLWVAFAVIVFFYSLFSFVLAYHWRTYAFDVLKVKLIMRLYFTVSIVLLMGMGAFLAAYHIW